MGEGRVIMVLAALQNGLRCLGKFLIHWGLSVLLRRRGGGLIINSHSKNVAVGECKNVWGGEGKWPPIALGRLILLGETSIARGFQSWWEQINLRQEGTYHIVLKRYFWFRSLPS